MYIRYFTFWVKGTRNQEHSWPTCQVHRHCQTFGIDKLYKLCDSGGKKPGYKDGGFWTEGISQTAIDWPSVNW